jgi:hypothetical protein
MALYKYPHQARMELAALTREELRRRHLVEKESLYHLSTNVVRCPKVRLQKIMRGELRPGPNEAMDMAVALGFEISIEITPPCPTSTSSSTSTTAPLES